MFLYDTFGLLVLILMGAFLLFIPLAAAGSLVWAFGKVKWRMDTRHLRVRQPGSKGSLFREPFRMTAR